MSLNYTVSSPLKVSGSSPNLIFEQGLNNITFKPSSTLTSTYDFILPANNGTPNQLLTLNSLLESEWSNDPTSKLDSLEVHDTTGVAFTNTTVRVVAPGMTLTPPAGIYYCSYVGSCSLIDDQDTLEYGFAVNNVFRTNTLKKFEEDRTGFNFITEIISLNGLDTLTVEYLGNTPNPSMIYNIFNRSLILIKLN